MGLKACLGQAACTPLSQALLDEIVLVLPLAFVLPSSLAATAPFPQFSPRNMGHAARGPTEMQRHKPALVSTVCLLESPTCPHSQLGHQLPCLILPSLEFMPYRL